MGDISFVERSTAVNAVRAQAPSAKIEAICLDDYPVRVTVSIRKDGSEKVIFETDQRNLFSKYADKRQQSIARIKDAVKSAMA